MSIFHFLDHLDEIEKLLYQLPKPSYICFCLNYLVFKQKNICLPWLETAWSGWILSNIFASCSKFSFSVYIAFICWVRHHDRHLLFLSEKSFYIFRWCAVPFLSVTSCVCFDRFCVCSYSMIVFFLSENWFWHVFLSIFLFSNDNWFGFLFPDAFVNSVWYQKMEASTISIQTILFQN